ncbi:hypothetical protein [Mammaliicoccus vitulinus]|nr:hypothetical protein [Mammaliicoccus vitulinus]QJF24512.1 hypothetical protein HF021_03080 [Mammaliicoccus vitulinus]
MKIGKYRIDSMWLSMILGFVFVSLVVPPLWFSVFALLYFTYKSGGIEKE